MTVRKYHPRPATLKEVAKETSLPFTKEQIKKIIKKYPTPFYIYDEAGIRQNARNFMETFSWAPKFRNFFAVKALPQPHILKILKEEGFGVDCSSKAELEMAKRVGFKGEEMMFSSNNTPVDQFALAKKLGVIINLDDITHLAYLEKNVGLPEILSFRYNPGPLRKGNAIIGKPEEAKYGLRHDQLFEAYRMAKEKGVKKFGLHTMVISNELNPDYFIETARMLFKLVEEVNKKVGVKISFINLGGGVGVPYKLDQKPVDIKKISVKMEKDYQQMIVNKKLDPLQITMECGRYITGPHGWFVANVRHITEKYRDYIGLDGSINSFLRIAMYGAYHHLTVLGKEGKPREKLYDVTGSLCENNDKFATQRELPEIDIDDIVAIHEGGAHAIAMANEYNGQLIPKELLLRSDGSVLEIRRERTVKDYFTTIVNFPGF